MLVVVVLVALGLTLWGFYPVARVQYREERDYAQLRAEYASIQERNVRLGKQVATLQTASGIEDRARESLGLVKRGEHSIVVVDKSQPATGSAASKVPNVDIEEPVKAPRGPWTPVLDFVFGVRE